MRTYKELIKLKTFDERLDYLKIGGGVGYETFGPERYLNQKFYKSTEWKEIRDYVIARDLGCDMGLKGFDILGRPLIHHMNPINAQDIMQHSDLLLNPDYLITVSHSTHNAIHYGKLNDTPLFAERTAGDTTLW